MMLRICVCALALMAPAASSAAVPPAVLEQTEIVFDGRVARTTGVLLPTASGDSQLIAVDVERVIASPKTAALKEGDTVIVSVQFGVPALGARARYYTVGWIYGEQIAVRELAREAVPAVPAGDERRSIAAGMRAAKLKVFVNAADAAMVGRVTRITIPAAGRRTPVSEHDPMWREAEVSVQTWIKGGPGRRIIVRFPASVDVAWYQVAKLRVGESWTLLLHEEPDAAGARDIPRYRIETPLDALPVEDAPLVKSLVRR